MNSQSLILWNTQVLNNQRLRWKTAFAVAWNIHFLLDTGILKVNNSFFTQGCFG